MRSTRRLLAIAGLLAAMAMLAGTPAAAHQDKTLSMVKNCAAWPPTCVITSSRPLGFMVGSVITYLAPLSLETPAGTDVRITTANGKGSAPGHCMFDWAALPAPAGLCTFTSGTGKLAGFNSRLNVAWIGGSSDFTLRGTYEFDRENNSDRDDNDD